MCELWRSERVHPSLWQVCGVITKCLRSFFPCELCSERTDFFSVDLHRYLGHGSVNRHVFDLDGVCHVGEMISAPADVLKGAAGKVNHGAKAKARPAIHKHTKTHCASIAAADVCLFSILTHPRQNRQIRRQTHTHVWKYTHTTTKGRLFCFVFVCWRHHPVPTHLFCHLSFFASTHSNAHTLTHLYITQTVAFFSHNWLGDVTSRQVVMWSAPYLSLWKNPAVHCAQCSLKNHWDRSSSERARKGHIGASLSSLVAEWVDHGALPHPKIPCFHYMKCIFMLSTFSKALSQNNASQTSCYSTK